MRLCKYICESGLEGLGFHKSFIKFSSSWYFGSSALIQNRKIFSHIFVWGSCFWFCIPPPPPPPRPPPPPHHIIVTHNFVTHHLSHTTLSHTIFHTQLCHPPSLSHTIFHTQLCHTQSFTHTSLSHTTLSHWHLVTCTAALCVAGVALGDIQRHFVWQAWHLATSTFVLRGRPGTYGTGLALVARWAGIGRRWCCGTLRHRRGTWRHRPSFSRGRRGTTICTWWRAWSPLVAGDAAALCLAGVAQSDIHLRFTWQAWHLVRCCHVFSVWR